MRWNPFARQAPPAAAEPRREPTVRLPRGASRPFASTGMRGFGAGTVDLLTGDFPALIQSGNAALRPALRTMRARSRYLAENNDYMRSFLTTINRKVLGPDGMRLVVRAMRQDGLTVDQVDSDYLERAFAEWSRKGNCTVCGRYSFADVQRLVLTTAARDGEILVRMVRNFPNKWGFALQLFEGDVLNEELNVGRGQGFGGVDKALDSEIRMGVERDRWGRVIAYHILTRHPGDDVGGYWDGSTRYTRLPAADVLHMFISDRVDDARGAPWAWTAMRRLQMIGGYEEAELVAARLGASKGGFFEEDPEAETPSDWQDAASEQPVREVTPGQFDVLPTGVRFKEYAPNHPNANLPAFLKAMLRGVASGLGVAYNGLARDLEGVNFSSLRGGELDERDGWRVLQGWTRNDLCEPVYSAWLDMALLTGALNLPPSKRDKFDADVWHGRGWPWVDPSKDISAEVEAHALGIRSLTQICAERGVEFEDVLRERKREQELAKQYGVEINLAAKPTAPPPPDPNPQETGQ